MFQMSPYQSWSTVVVLLLFVAAFIWLMREVQKHFQKGRAVVDEGQALARRARMAIVPDLPDEEVAPEGHLAIVTPLRRTPEPDLYDWQKQGI